MIETPEPRKPKVSVLSVIHSATYGGPHNQAAQLRRASNGLDMTVVIPDEEGNAEGRLAEAGVPVVRMTLLRPRADRANQSILGLFAHYPGQVARLSGLIRRSNADVVEVHGLLNLDGALAARIARRGLIWQLIDTRPPRWMRWLLMPIILTLSDVIMTTGEALANEYPGVRARQLHTFVPPVAPPEFYDEIGRSRARKRLGVPDGAVVVASIGNFNPQKGFALLIEGVASLPSGSVVLRIRGGVQPGHEGYLEELRELATRRGLDTATVGPVEDEVGIEGLLQAADLFALTPAPRSEGIPTVILEAMCRALPVVSTKVGAIPEVVADGQTGLLVTPGDATALRIALSRLVTNPGARARMGNEGRLRALEMASPARFAGTMEAAVGAALNHRRRR